MNVTLVEPISSLNIGDQVKLFGTTAESEGTYQIDQILTLLVAVVRSAKEITNQTLFFQFV
jgi:hypothetical protein